MVELIIDVGNTKSKLALASGGALTSDVVLADHEKTASEALRMACEARAACCLISSVAEGADALVETLVAGGLPSRLLRGDLRLPFAIDYATPHTLGSDRVAGIAGVVANYGLCDALVIDAGTAITYDYLTADGRFIGGAISPGISMRFKALHAFTAKLPLCSPDDTPGSPVAKDTRSAIASGVMNGVWAEANRFVSEMRVKSPKSIVVLSGGDYKNFDLSSKIGIFARPNLVLEGLAFLAHENLDILVTTRTC